MATRFSKMMRNSLINTALAVSFLNGFLVFARFLIHGPLYLSCSTLSKYTLRVTISIKKYATLILVGTVMPSGMHFVLL